MARWMKSPWRSLPRCLLVLACSESLARYTAAAVSQPALLQDDAQAPMCLLQRTSAAAGRPAPAGQRSPEGGGSLDSVEWGFNEDASARKEAPVSVPVHDDLRDTMKALLEHQITAIRAASTKKPVQEAPAPVSLPVHDDLRDTLKALLEHQITAVRSASSSSKKFVQEDELLRFQDDRLRQQDEELRKENYRLQLLLAKLSAANQSSVDEQPLTASLLSSLLLVTMEPTTNSSNSSTNSTNSTAAAKKGSAKHSRMKTLLIIGGCFAAFALYVTYHAVYFFRGGARTYDRDGDGDIDLGDFREYMSENICCGLSYASAKKVSFVLLLAALGFAFLWSQNIIQPFLKELTCYIYLGAVVVLVLGVILAEMWSKFFDTFNQISEMLEKVTNFATFNQGEAFKDVMHKAGLK